MLSGRIPCGDITTIKVCFHRCQTTPFPQQLTSPHFAQYKDLDYLQVAIPLKIRKYIKESFNDSQQQAILNIIADTNNSSVMHKDLFLHTKCL